MKSSRAPGIIVITLSKLTYLNEILNTTTAATLTPKKQLSEEIRVILSNLRTSEKQYRKKDFSNIALYAYRQ
jgi:hypothetical protein